MDAFGYGSVACLKNYVKWNRAWQQLSLRREKGNNGAGLIRAVNRSCAFAVEDLYIEAWGMLTWDGNQDIVSASS